ncbi:MAG TPA: 50S ribosomal protein L13 [Nitrospiria bacterium]|nr:50S ribosomal protein L13 [Nitrospiria bacterium]
MKTVSIRKEDITRKWYVVDASEKILGRLASEVASILRGKHKPQFTPYLDLGDHVVVINAGKIKLTGNKLKDKVYYHHSGYPKGLKSRTAGDLMKDKPEEVVSMAIKGMLPKNRLGKAMAKKLKIYGGPEHPHQAQTPEVLEIEMRKRA